MAELLSVDCGVIGFPGELRLMVGDGHFRPLITASDRFIPPSNTDRMRCTAPLWIAVRGFGAIVSTGFLEKILIIMALLFWHGGCNGVC
jgi:hypothetical protein